MQLIQIQNLTKTGRVYTIESCTSFWSRFKGLMGRNTIGQYDGILLIDHHETVSNASIHMFFMKFDITAVWIDKHNRIVDVQLAKKWHPFYAPKAPAKAVLETRIDYFSHFHIGDQLTIKNA